jgi:hypothetical protein
MVGRGIRWLASAIILSSALAVGSAGAAAPENTALAQSGQRSGVAALRSELVSLRSGLPSSWSRFWLDNAIESADWAATSTCWTESGDLVATPAGLGCLHSLRIVALRLYYADAALRLASSAQRDETVGLIASIASDRLTAVAAAQSAPESTWLASGPTQTLWSVRTDLAQANADPNRIEATIGYIRAWRRLTIPADVPLTETTPQLIAFGPLAGKVLGDPDFGVNAAASSGLPVGFAAVGNCTVTGITVHLTGAGSCTVTASQAGDSTFDAAPDVSRSFSIAKAGETSRPGQPTGAGQTATTGAGQTTTTGAGQTATTGADQTATPSTSGATTGGPSSSFKTAAIKRATRCKVPNLVGRRLTTAVRAIKAGHCSTGKVTHAFSRRGKKGIVISQNRRHGRLLLAKAKINVVVSRGRKH